MGAVNTTYTFTATDTITSTKMNDIIDQTTFTNDAVFDTTLAVASGKLKVNAQGITSNELAANAVTTVKIADSNVTTEKIANANVTQAKFAPNTTGTGPIFRAYTTSDKYPSDGIFTKIFFDATSLNAGTPSLPFSISTGRFTVPVSGVYLILSKVQFMTNGQNIGARVTELWKNGIQDIRLSQTNTVDFTTLDISLESGYALTSLTAGDYLELYVYVDTASGGAGKISNGAEFCGFLLYQV